MLQKETTLPALTNGRKIFIKNYLTVTHAVSIFTKNFSERNFSNFRAHPRHYSFSLGTDYFKKEGGNAK